MPCHTHRHTHTQRNEWIWTVNNERRERSWLNWILDECETNNKRNDERRCTSLCWERERNGHAACCCVTSNDDDAGWWCLLSAWKGFICILWTINCPYELQLNSLTRSDNSILSFSLNINIISHMTQRDDSDTAATRRSVCNTLHRSLPSYPLLYCVSCCLFLRCQWKREIDAESHTMHGMHIWSLNLCCGQIELPEGNWINIFSNGQWSIWPKRENVLVIPIETVSQRINFKFVSVCKKYISSVPLWWAPMSLPSIYRDEEKMLCISENQEIRFIAYRLLWNHELFISNKLPNVTCSTNQFNQSSMFGQENINKNILDSTWGHSSATHTLTVWVWIFDVWQLTRTAIKSNTANSAT